jgi:hypothetical protein
MPDKDFLAEHSTYIENVMRHCFLYEITRHLLSFPEPQMLTILDSEVDSDGVDVILVHRAITRHIQMKTLANQTTNNPYSVAESLSGMAGACILWICYDRETMRPTGYQLMGGRGNAPLQDLTQFPVSQRRKKGQMVPRPGYRAIRIRHAAHRNLQLPALAEVLFDLPAPAPQP